MSGQAARVAKLVDALSSGGSIRKDVLVRIQSRAQKEAVSKDIGKKQPGREKRREVLIYN